MAEPLELRAPDITPYRCGNTGVDYVHELDSGRPGPTVMVQALTHGNRLNWVSPGTALLFLEQASFKPSSLDPPRR